MAIEQQSLKQQANSIHESSEMLQPLEFQSKKVEEQQSQENIKMDEKYNKIITSKIYKKYQEVKKQIKNKLKKKGYKPKKKFNCGGFGLVRLGIDKSNNNEIVIKIFSSNERIDKNESISEEKQIYEKLKTIKKYNHFVEFIDHVPLIEKWDAFIYKKYKCSLESLYCTKEKKISFTEKNLIKFIFDLIHGLIDLKRLSILHLDIKPQNILVDENNNLFYCDFGCSKIQKEDEEITVKTFTQRFAPKEQQQGKNVEYSSDLFSLGETLKIILDLFIEINSNSKIKSFAESVKNITLEKMIQEEKENRLDCQDIHYQFSKLFQEMDKEFISKDKEFFDELQTKIKYQLEDNVDYFFENIYKSLDEAKEKIKKQGTFQLSKNSAYLIKKNIIRSISDFSNLNIQFKEKMNQQIQEELDILNQKFEQLIFKTKENNQFDFKIYEDSIKKMDEFLKKNLKENVNMQVQINNSILEQANSNLKPTENLQSLKSMDDGSNKQNILIKDENFKNLENTHKSEQNIDKGIKNFSETDDQNMINPTQQSNLFNKREEIKDSYQQRSIIVPQEKQNSKSKQNSMKIIKQMNVQKPNS